MVDYKTFDDITILSATYNKHYFTLIMLESFFEVAGFLPNTVIIDNSTETYFPKEKNEFITVIDNTNFKYTKNYHQPSKNHCSSIEYALSNIKTKYVLLCDNDIIFKRPALDIIAQRHNYDIIGEVNYDIIPPNRLFPYFCIIDLDYIKSKDIHYFDNNRCMINDTMDTGCSFYEDLLSNEANIKTIKLSDYIVHLKGGTLR